MSWEERFYEDLLPEIESYAEEETTAFTSSDIAERLEDYTPQKVGKTLKYMSQEEGTHHIINTGNNPKTWEAVLFRGTAWERIAHELDVEPQEPEKEEVAKQFLEENPEETEEQLYSSFLRKAKEYEAFNNAAESIETIRDQINQRRPQIDSDILEIGDPEYGRIRSNIGKVYRGLEEIKENDYSVFRTKDLNQKLDNVRGAEIGLVLSGLATAGLIEKYGENSYMTDSVDLEEIQEFQRAVKNLEDIEDLQDFFELRD